MRFRRNILFLLGLICFLSGGLVMLRLLRPTLPLQTGDPLFPYPQESVVAIGWDTQAKDGTLVPMQLVRQGEFWYMERPFAHVRCDDAAVSDLLDAALSLRVRSHLSDAAAKTFRAERNLRLRVADAERTCGLGEILPMGLSETLAEMRGSLVAVEAATVKRLPTTAAAVRTRAVLPAAPERITALEWRQPGKPFTRAQRQAGGNWSVSQPFPFEVVGGDVRKALVTLTEAATIAAYVQPADDVAFDDKGMAPACPTAESALVPYGLDEETALRVVVHVQGHRETITLRFGKADPARPGHVFCLLNHFQAVVSVPEALPALFGTQGPFVTDYRNLPVIGDAERFTQMTIRAAADATRTELEKGARGWEIRLPLSLPADAETLRTLQQGLAALKGDLIGVTAPDSKLLCTLTLTTAGENLPATLELYAPTATEPADAILVYRSDIQRLYRATRANLPEILLKGDYAHTLADRTILAEPAEGIRRITLLYPDGTQTTVARLEDSQEWATEEPRGAYVDRDRLDHLLTTFADLQAQRVVRTLPMATDALKPYGLDQPQLRLTLDLTGDKGLRRVLLVGTKDPKTGAIPAIIQGRPILYELSDEQLQALNQAPIKPPASEE